MLNKDFYLISIDIHLKELGMLRQ